MREIIVSQMAITTTKESTAGKGSGVRLLSGAGEAPRFTQVCSGNGREGRLVRLSEFRSARHAAASQDTRGGLLLS